VEKNYEKLNQEKSVFYMARHGLGSVGGVQGALHVQTGNRAGFLSLDLGMADWGIEIQNRLQKYREFIYETGALDTGKGTHLDPKMVSKERKKGYKLTVADRLRFKTRYFTDSGVIGTKEFVARNSNIFSINLSLCCSL
jgi:hypothetical protein